MEKPEALDEKIKELLKIPRNHRKINHTVVVKDNVQ
jgi:ribosomal protein L30/L7E